MLAESNPWRNFDVVKFLASTDLFRGLNEDQLKQIGSLCQRMAPNSDLDQPIVAQDKPAPGIYFVISGTVQLTRRALPNAAWSEWRHREVEPGELWGEVEFAHDENLALTTAKSLETPVLLLLIQREPLWELIHENPEMALGIMRRLARRYMTRVIDLTEFRKLTPEKRFYLYLYRNAVDRDITSTSEELATIVGCTRENIQKFLSNVSHMAIGKSSKKNPNYCVTNTMQGRERHLRVHDPDKLLRVMRRHWYDEPLKS